MRGCFARRRCGRRRLCVPRLLPAAGASAPPPRLPPPLLFRRAGSEEWAGHGPHRFPAQRRDVDGGVLGRPQVGGDAAPRQLEDPRVAVGDGDARRAEHGRHHAGEAGPSAEREHAWAPPAVAGGGVLGHELVRTASPSQAARPVLLLPPARAMLVLGRAALLVALLRDDGLSAGSLESTAVAQDAGVAPQEPPRAAPPPPHPAPPAPKAPASAPRRSAPTRGRGGESSGPGRAGEFGGPTGWTEACRECAAARVRRGSGPRAALSCRIGSPGTALPAVGTAGKQRSASGHRAVKQRPSAVRYARSGESSTISVEQSRKRWRQQHLLRGAPAAPAQRR